MEVEDVLIQEDLDPKQSLNYTLYWRITKEMGYNIFQDWPCLIQT